MRCDQSFIDEVMFLFDEERMPISSIASAMNVSIDVIDCIICCEIAYNTMEVT
jgi:hypothetical protein